MVLTILRAPGLVTVQDLGRVGFAHLGVPRAGALDAPAAALANRLVGNVPAAAVLETTLLGVAFSTDRALSIAVTGAACTVTVDGRHRAHGEPVTAAAGAIIEIGPATSGVRSYVAVAGGVEVGAVLGSRSTDTLAGIGPPRLAPDMTVPVGRPRRPHPVDTIATPRPNGAMRLFPGPRLDWFTAGAWQTLTHASYAVTGDANRVGVRLRGPVL
ncbi:MAG: biotin-dependent carboxyltransferase family protein, partial [Nocardioidaceae bacterium]|nr:biotin-dependent carboxyltransferase family protein [Nocardioidaceae bacterium]